MTLLVYVVGEMHLLEISDNLDPGTVLCRLICWRLSDLYAVVCLDLSETGLSAIREQAHPQ